jgi:hypothetical protein
MGARNPVSTKFANRNEKYIAFLKKMRYASGIGLRGLRGDMA